MWDLTKKPKTLDELFEILLEIRLNVVGELEHDVFELKQEMKKLKKKIKKMTAEKV